MKINRTTTKTRAAAGKKAAQIDTRYQQESRDVVIVYTDLSPPGLSWKSLAASVPANLAHKVRRIKTSPEHGFLVFRSAMQRQGYKRLASLDGIEVMVRFTATTNWGNRILEHPRIRASKPQVLPVLLHEEELILEQSLRRMARTANLTTP